MKTVVVASLFADGGGHIGIFRDEGQAAMKLIELGCSLDPIDGIVVTEQFIEWLKTKFKLLLVEHRLGKPVHFNEVVVGSV
jgi:hypothetical protein